jgi:probable rRNA maturation factor
MMRFKITLKIDPDFKAQIEPKVIQATARAALEFGSAPVPAEVTIVLTDDRALHLLNLDYLNHDYPTDVLAFPLGELDPETGRHYLGDIAISFPQAGVQAQKGGHSVMAEVQLLVVHGLLHLLGHDHGQPEEQARMWAAQAEILEQLQVEITPPGAQKDL